MRKGLSIKSFYAFFFLLLISCSNDNEAKDTIPEEKTILIKKITETIYYSGSSDTKEMNFVYDKNVLKSITSGVRKSDFEYNGDKITKVSSFNNGTAVGYTTFNYTNNLLTSTLSGEKQDEKTEYFYNNGILASEKSSYFNNGNYIVQSEASFVFDSNENITQTTAKSLMYGPERISKNKYFYDSKNHPMKFMNKYYRLVFVMEGFDGKAKNNVTSEEYYYPVTTETPAYLTFDITYNDDNFPIEIKKISKESNTLISKTTIGYQ